MKVCWIGGLTRRRRVSRWVMLVRSGRTWTRLIARAKYAVPGTRDPDLGSERIEYACPKAKRAKNLHLLAVQSKASFWYIYSSLSSVDFRIIRWYKYPI